MSEDIVGTRDVSCESTWPGKYYRKQLLECLASWLYMFLTFAIDWPPHLGRLCCSEILNISVTRCRLLQQ